MYLNPTLIPLLLRIIFSIRSIVLGAYMPNQRLVFPKLPDVDLRFAYDEESQPTTSYFEIDMLLLLIFV